MRNVEVKVYYFEELSSGAQDYVLENYQDELEELRESSLESWLEDCLLDTWSDNCDTPREFIQPSCVRDDYGSIEFEYEIDWELLRERFKDSDQSWYYFDLIEQARRRYEIEEGDIRFAFQFDVPEYLQDYLDNINSFVDDRVSSIRDELEGLWQDERYNYELSNEASAIGWEYFEDGRRYDD